MTGSTSPRSTAAFTHSRSDRGLREYTDTTDLWPLYREGDASADSKSIVEAFLAEDTAFATTLKQSDAMPQMMPALRLSPDAERQLLDDARDRARMKMLVVGGTIALVGLIALVCPAGAMFMVFGG